MKRCHILLLILITAAVVAGGCTAPQEDPANARPVSPTSSPVPTEVQAVGAGQPAPTPAVPAGAEKIPKSVGFVDPQTYHLPTPTPTIATSARPDDLQVSGSMVRYATAAASNRPPGLLATEVYHIPFPYWAVNVSATPRGEYPWLTMELYGRDDPNHIVKAVKYSRNDFPYSEGEFQKKEEQFTILEGHGDYYFVIRSGSLKSLEITVLIPEKYLV